MLPEANDYRKELARRGKASKVYRKHQLIGLELARLLGDNAHKALYMKIAKKSNPETLLDLAKSIVEKKSIRNKGAYFMSLVAAKKK